MKEVWGSWKAQVLGLALATVVFAVGASATAAPWKFGVMADTQWAKSSDGKNPNGVGVGVIEALNAQFIAQKVDFVIQVGDLTQDGDDIGLKTRADAAEALYKAGIGFFPLRGNHEGKTQASAQTFQTLYPQTRNKGANVFGATNFSSPLPALEGLSYSFDHKNARFVLLDQFTRADGSSAPGGLDNNTLDQLDWITSRLSGKPADSHGFVFAHKNLIGQNHEDTLYGKDPSANPEAQNRLMSCMVANGARYAMGGHDHMHHRSLIKSPDGKSQVQELICSSNAYKFYVPNKPSNDSTYNGSANLRETPISQELGTIGYYIFTVDGPRVSVDYYASDNGQPGNGMTGPNPGRINMTAMPPLAFTRRETYGYSLNGREFIVAQGESYAKTEDRFGNTSAKILDGINGSKNADFAARPLSKAVDTGWTPKDAADTKNGVLASDILTLWGMAELGSDQTDTYVLSMTYDPEQKLPSDYKNGGFGLVTRNAAGQWIDAVDANTGGSKKLALGPWKSEYGLGTYGIDTATHTAWAVINRNGDYAVAELKAASN